ncbi:MAG: energy transducer TonB [Rhodanobacter lindaniclasticus]
MKYGMPGLLCMMLAGVALAAGPRAASEQMQASMLVRGSITVAADGSVKSYLVDHPEQLPREVVNLIARNVPKWRFEPVARAGQPVIAQAAMDLRVVAKPLGNDEFALSVAGTNFGRPSSHAAADSPPISYKRRPPPAYPALAANARVWGTVYLLLAIDHVGRVQHVDAEQVNLGVVGGDREMGRWRHALAQAAVSAARDWTFNVPAPASGATSPHWLVRVPVAFTFASGAEPRYGVWHRYLPGPRVMPAWAGKLDSGDSADAVGAGSISAVGEGLRRAKPFEGA